MADLKPSGKNKRPQIKFSMYWMYAFVLLFLFGMFYLDDNSITKKVSYSEFENYITDSVNARSHGITRIVVDKRKGVAEAQLSDSLTKAVFQKSQYKEGARANITATLPSTDEFARKIDYWKQQGVYNGPVDYDEGSDLTSFQIGRAHV